MLKHLLRRVVATIPVMFGVSVVTFLMLHLIPGDPIRVMFADSPLSGDQIEALRTRLGLNDPLPVQYGHYISDALRGDLGRSIRNGRPVTQLIMGEMPSTIKLTLTAMVIAIFLGLTLGCLAALHRNTWLDALSMGVALIGVSMPSFWLGLMLIFLFSIQLGWFPPVGGSGLQGLILPATALGLFAAAIIARVARSSVLEVLGMDCVRTARAKGLRERTIVLRHVLPNALIPVVTIVGLQMGTLLSGAVIIETVFARRGLGRLMVNAILAKDFPLVQGAVLFTALIYVGVNLLTDIAYVWLDPRIHYD